MRRNIKLSEHIRKIEIKILIVQILSIFCVNSGICKENQQERQSPEILNEVTEVVNTLAEYQYLQWKHEPNLIKSSLPDLYQILSKKYSPIIENCLSLYRVRILLDMERHEEMIKLAKEQVNSLDKPNLLPLLINFNRENESKEASEIGECEKGES